MLSYFTDIIAEDNTLVQLQFSTLDLSSKRIKFIDNIHTKLMFISYLFLDNNNIKSLDGIWQFKNLQTLQFNFNYVQNEDELYKIINPFFMKNLSFIGNLVQKKINKNWLKINGFKNLQTINSIDRIGRQKQKQKYKIVPYNYRARMEELNKQQNTSQTGTPYKQFSNTRSQQNSNHNRSNRKIGKIYRNSLILHQQSQQKDNMFENQSEKSPQFYRTINRSQIAKLVNLLNLSDNSITQRYYQDLSQANSDQITRRINGESRVHQNIFVNVNEMQNNKTHFLQTGDTSRNYYRKNISKKLASSNYQDQQQKQVELHINQVNPFKLNPFQQTDEEIQNYMQQFIHSCQKSKSRQLLNQRQNQYNNRIQETALAFYYKNLREKAFKDWKHNISNFKVVHGRDNLLKMRWGWVKLRLFTTKKKIIQQYSSWGIQNS